MLAAKYAIEYPLKVKSLVLCNAMPPSFRLWQEEEKTIATKLTAYDTLMWEKIKSNKGFKDKDVKWVDSLMKFTFRKQFFDTTQLSKLTIKLPWDYFKRSEIFAHLAPELFSFDITGQLEKIISPTLIIYGDQEPATQISAPVYKSKVTNSKMVIISKSGHFPFIEQPEQFNQAVNLFWNSIKK
jgi:proline iminopeptidase